MHKLPDNVSLSADGKSVVIIDQTLLPNETKHLTLNKQEELYEAIYTLRVRGAPAIGIFAAFALYVLAQQQDPSDKLHWFSKLHENADYLASSRPTAVNLRWALNRMLRCAIYNEDKDISEILLLLKQECIQIQLEDIEMCKRISEYGLTLIRDGSTVLTHCNAGPLATSLYGTGLGTLILGKERGLNLSAYVDETRPLMQGARLTAYELHKAGIDVTLICDNMAGMVMKQGKIDACFVGCDRVAANGDTANKIGTSTVAVLAKHYGVPFYVFCPSSTIDFNCKTGDEIEIELRKDSEIAELFFTSRMTPMGVKCYNPAFDITDAELITAIITEKGICRYPYTKSLSALFQKGKETV
jgi:methylthioribose-1-phosphate isomerase